jgi:hypothetical protein
MREFPVDFAQALFEKAVGTIAISTAVALTVTPGASAPKLSVTLPVSEAKPHRLNAFIEWTSENSNAGATKYLGMSVPPREWRLR